MRIPEYLNIKYNLSPWFNKSVKVQKAHEDQFEDELEDNIKKRNLEVKRKTKKTSKEFDMKDVTPKEILPNDRHFSSWS